MLARYTQRLDAVGVAIQSLLDGNIASYTLDTTQGRQVVTKQTISVLMRYENELLAQIERLENKANFGGDAVVSIAPNF